MLTWSSMVYHPSTAMSFADVPMSPTAQSQSPIPFPRVGPYPPSANYHAQVPMSSATRLNIATPLSIATTQANPPPSEVSNENPSHENGNDNVGSEDLTGKGRCPESGKLFTDLKTYILTHQNVPRKCPVQTCEYHTKGFHEDIIKIGPLLPSSRTPWYMIPATVRELGWESFQRVDTFEGHLTGVHAVDQALLNR